MRQTALAAAIVAVSAGSASAQLLDFLSGRLFWQGSWGVASETPVITVNGSEVSYVGVDEESFPASEVEIARSEITFLAGPARVSLTKLSDNSIVMVSTVAGNSSPPIVLCRKGAAGCP